MNFAVHTQFCENYDVDGDTASGYWKYKWGSSFLIKNANREATAAAWVQRHLCGSGNFGVEYVHAVYEFSEDDEAFLEEFEYVDPQLIDLDEAEKEFAAVKATPDILLP